MRYSRKRVETVAEEYGIRALNDYVDVQKKVVRTLREQGFFENGNNIVFNEATGYEIEIGKKGIEETFGPGKRYERLSATLKKLKLATVRDLPEIIRNARVLESGVENTHNSASQSTFDYLEGVAEVSGESYRVKIVVKRSALKNKFYLHEVQLENGAPHATVANGTANDITVLPGGDTVTDSIAQERSDVNPSDEKNVRTARKRAAETADDRFSRYNAELKETFRQNIDQWEREGRPQDEVFAVGVAGDIVQGLGAQESTVRLYGEKVDRILHDHPEITLKEIKQIPQILDDPAVVLKSKYRGEDNSRLIFIGDVKAKNGLPVMVILDVNSAEENGILGSIERVTSTYTKTSGLARFLQSSEYVYVNKKEAIKLLVDAGLPIIQPPASMNDGFVGSISHHDEKVKIHAKSFSEIFSDNGVRTARKKGKNADSRAFEDAVRRMEESDIENMVERDFEDAVERIEQHEQEIEQAEAQVQAQGEASEGMSDSLKSYSRKEAREMMAEVNRLLTEQAAEQFGDAQKTIDTYLRWGNANRISEALWLKLNSVETAEERTKAFTEVAEQIVRDSRLRVVLSEPEMRTQQTRLAAIQGLKGKLDLSAISAEIERHFGDEASRVTRYWRAGKGKPSMTIQEAVKLFTKKTRMEIDTGKDAIELLVQLEGMRQEAIETLYTNTRLALGEELSRATVEEGAASPMDEAVRKAAEILEQGWSSKGTRADRARIEEAVEAATKAVRASERIKAEAKKLVADQRQLMQTGRKLNAAKYKAERIKTWKSGEFRAASEPGNADLLAALGSLGAADQRGNFSPASARKAMAKVADWYAQPADRKSVV